MPLFVNLSAMSEKWLWYIHIYIMLHQTHDTYNFLHARMTAPTLLAAAACRVELREVTGESSRPGSSRNVATFGTSGAARAVEMSSEAGELLNVGRSMFEQAPL